MAFSSSSDTAVNKARADRTFENCQKSESKGFILLSGVARMATTVTNLGLTTIDPANPPTAEQLEAILDNVQAHPESAADLGTSVIAIYQSNCTTQNATNSTSNQTVCTEMNSAIQNAGGTLDPTAIGNMIADQLQQRQP